jgi:hypothetical protein
MSDDDDIQDYVVASGWRKRQIEQAHQNIRNDTIEEVAKEIEKMTAFGTNTIASFTVHIRSMKKGWV